MLQIDKHIPAPTRAPTRGVPPGPVTAAIRALDIGHSVYIPDTMLNTSAVRVRVAKIGKKGDKRFVTQREGTGTRVWRVPLSPTDDLA